MKLFKKKSRIILLIIVLIGLIIPLAFLMPQTRGHLVKLGLEIRSNLEHTFDLSHTEVSQQTETVPFESKSEEDPSRESGYRGVCPFTGGVCGETGEKIVTYKKTIKGKDVIKTEKISEQITKQPVTEIVKYGTKQKEAIQATYQPTYQEPSSFRCTTNSYFSDTSYTNCYSY